MIGVTLAMFLIYLLLLLLVAITGFWLWQASKPVAETKPMMHSFGAGTSQVEPLPKIIWSYWHDNAPPLVVQQCLAGWQTLNPEYQIHLVNADTIKDFIDDIPANLHQHHVTKQADWLRLALLAKYGGLWLDASIILTKPLSQWLETYLQQGSFFGFYLERNCKDFSIPLLENWLIAAKPHDPFIQDWFQVFETEVIEKGTSHYLEQLKADKKLQTLTVNIDTPDYHTMHVVAQQLLLQDNAPSKYALTLMRAEDSAYRLHTASQWRRKRLYWRLLLLKVPSALPPLIKLRGGERKKLEPYLQRGWYRANSIAGQFLATKKIR